MDKPLVSILMPCYNHEKYLDDALKALLNQSYENMELIIGDDNSTDCSLDRIKNYESILNKKFYRFILLKNSTNLGLTRNLNKMLKEVKGTYIKVISSDDFLKPEAIMEFVSYMENNREIGVGFSNGFCVKEESCYEKIIFEKQYYKEFEMPENIVESLYSRNFIFAPGAFVRKEMYDLYGLYDEKSGVEDWEYWLRLAANNVRFGYIDIPLVYYRLNGKSMSNIVYGDAKTRTKFLNLYNNEMYILKKYSEQVSNKLYKMRLTNSLHDYYMYAITLQLFDIAYAIKKEDDFCDRLISKGEHIYIFMKQIGIYSKMAKIKNILWRRSKNK